LFLATMFAAIPSCSQPVPEDQSSKDRTAIQGEWEIVFAESNGAPPPPGLLDHAKFVFTGDKMSLLGKDATFELDATKNPAQIDFKNSRQIGIYEFNGDDLKLCFGPSDDRPKEFKTKPRTDHSLFVLKRKR
jgi:uncharacterized protein (TIGR03067 family)